MASQNTTGRVLVLGGGISGIEASLSLSRAGYGVYLVERMGFLGGMIPNLHRLYPVCACCKLDPRIAACEQDPNIKVLLNTNVLGISGGKGNFKVEVGSDGKNQELDVGAIVLATGIEPFDPSKYDTYSYGKYANVMTSVEYEQMQKPVGPGKGQITRPSDGKIPQRVAWLQCVGSRDINKCDAPYCSTVCCMYALKEAINTKDFDETIETTIFYMDMRAHGKGFEKYLNTAQLRGVRLERSRIHTIEAVEDDKLLLTYVDEKDELQKEIFDLVVLSVGLRPASEGIHLAQQMGVEISTEGYVTPQPFSEVQTNVPGVLVCGGMTAPTEIKDSIIQVNALTSEISSFLDPLPFSERPAYPSIHQVNAPPKILFAYHICKGMDPALGKKAEEIASKLEGVVAVAALGDDLLTDLSKKIKETEANRVVFATCLPNSHQALLEGALRLSGLNPYLYETVDLRLVWDEGQLSQLANRIHMGVARAGCLTAPTLKEVEVFKRALVVGGGLAGMQSALSISNSGYDVTLVEKEGKLGGHALHVKDNWRGNDVQSYVKTLIDTINKNKKITVLLNAQVKRSVGSPGHFVTTVTQGDEEIEIQHGVTILATGGNPIKPSEYLYGKHKDIFIWSELSTKLIEDPAYFQKANCAVFVQCVGSREPDRPYCSNFCCTFSIRTALDLKEINPDMDIYILYRDIRTFGLRESLYRKARERGVVFIRYSLEDKPVISADDPLGKLRVTVTDHILKRPITIEPDFISLQSAITSESTGKIGKIFGVDLDEDGFFAESPEKLRPVDSTAKGVFIAGLGHYPKDSEESLTQAKAAAGRALEILTKDTVQLGGRVAEVHPDKCAVCCTCVRTCPFHIPYIDHDTGAAYIDPGLCQGCGMCVAECPGKAITMATCSDEMLNQAPALLLGTS